MNTRLMTSTIKISTHRAGMTYRLTVQKRIRPMSPTISIQLPTVNAQDHMVSLIRTTTS